MRRLVAVSLLHAAISARAGEDLPSYGVSPQLPPDHWAVRAAARLDGVGLVTGWLPGYLLLQGLMGPNAG